MNPITVNDAKKLATDVRKNLTTIKKTTVVLCPPFVYLTAVSASKSSVLIGAQDAFYEIQGSFTGEISPAQLSGFNVDYVILGHSERRKMGETDELINKKVRSVISSGMNAVVCVGESNRDSGGEYFHTIKEQIEKALKDVSKKSISQVVVAYEPVWAIGAKEAMTSRDLHEMSIFIKKVLKDLYGILSDGVQIIYGGSVDKLNAGELVREGNVSGLLVGRQSLVAKDFAQIIKAVDNI